MGHLKQHAKAFFACDSTSKSKALAEYRQDQHSHRQKDCTSNCFSLFLILVRTAQQICLINEKAFFT